MNIIWGCYFLAYAHSSFLKSGNENKGSNTSLCGMHCNFNMKGLCWEIQRKKWHFQVGSVLFPLWGGDELPTFSYNILPSMILALFVPCHTRDRISKHSHSIVSRVSKHTGQSCHAANQEITLVEGVMEKRMVTGHSHWDYRQQ